VSGGRGTYQEENEDSDGEQGSKERRTTDRVPSLAALQHQEAQRSFGGKDTAQRRLTRQRAARGVTDGLSETGKLSGSLFPRRTGGDFGARKSRLYQRGSGEGGGGNTRLRYQGDLVVLEDNLLLPAMGE